MTLNSKATALESSNRKIRIRIEFRSPKPRSHRTKAMVSPTPSSYLTPTQKYAAGALFGLALHQAQLHQTHPLGLSTDEFPSSSSSTTRAVFEDPELWVHHTSGLLRPIFMYVSIIFFVFTFSVTRYLIGYIQNYNCILFFNSLQFCFGNDDFSDVLHGRKLG